MKVKILVLLLVFLGWNCKQNSGAKQPKVEEAKQEVKTDIGIPPTIKALVKFADIPITDSTDVNELIIFKAIEANGTVTHVEMDKAVQLYKAMNKPDENALPIFEIKNTETAILPIKGFGFGGAIWAKVLVDKNTMEIKKIAFGHQAETEGYGATMTQSTFENQFAGIKIDLEKNSYRLRQELEKIRDGGHPIDGISGATMTSEAAVEMVNEGLRKYRGYLKP